MLNLRSFGLKPRAEQLNDAKTSEALRGQIEQLQKARASYTNPPSPTAARAMKSICYGARINAAY